MTHSVCKAGGIPALSRHTSFSHWLTDVCRLALLCALCLSWPTEAFATNSPQLEISIAQSKEQALSFLRDGQFQQAYTMYMGLLREEPGDPDINLGLARAAQAVGEYNQAVLALERVTDMYPHDARLRVELARAHIRAGNPTGARNEFELARKLDPTITIDDIDKLMDKLSSTPSPWRANGRISAGIMYDSNVNMGPGSPLVQLGVWNLKLDDSATGRESWGGFITGSLDVAYRIAPEGPWWIVGDVGFYRKGYFEEIPVSRELAWGRAAAGLRRVGSKTLFDIRVRTDMADYMSDAQYAYSNGVDLMHVWGLTSSLYLISRASLERRDYGVQTGRQGWYMWVGEYLRFLYGESGHEIMLGGRYIEGVARNSAYDSTGWEASLRTVFKLPGKVDVAPFVSYRTDKYQGPATMLELKRREDENLRVGVGVTWAFAQSMTLDLTWQYTDNTSTSPLYIYDQSSVMFGLTYHF